MAERRAADVLPSDHATTGRGATTWTAALVASVARTGWLSAVVTIAFLGGAFGATWAGGQSVGGAALWILMGAGVWLALSVLYSALRRH